MSTVNDVLGRKGGTVLTVKVSVSVIDAIRTMSEAILVRWSLKITISRLVYLPNGTT